MNQATQNLTARLLVGLGYLGLVSFLLLDILNTAAAASFTACTCLLGIGLVLTGRFPFVRALATSSVAISLVLLASQSMDPAVSIRYALIAVITLVFPALATAVMSKRTYLTAIAYTLIALLLPHLLLGRRQADAWVGMLGSKNFFSLHMSITAIFALYLVLSARSPLRGLVGLLGLLGACVGIASANSAGAIISVTPVLMFIVIAMVYARTSPQNRGLLLISAGAVAATGLFILLSDFTAIRDAVLIAFSKDAGLTGRDYLWLRGWQYIQARPFFGYGYNAFWQQGNLEAEGLWRISGVAERGGFNFHNFFIHNLVDVGFVGFFFIFAYVVFATARQTLVLNRNPTPENAVLLSLILLFWERTYVELDFPVQFGLFSMLIGSVFAFSLTPDPDSVPRLIARRHGPVHEDAGEPVTTQ